MRHLPLLPLIVLLPSLACASFQGPARPPREQLPSDRTARHVETVTTPVHAYTVYFGGSVDGAMTRMPISYAAYRQGWQPNLSCRLENLGDTDVINPWLTANGSGDWRSLERIVAEATRGCTTDAERARAIWEWERHHRFHACTWDSECDDAAKVHNLYGYTLCGDDAIIIDDMFRAAGLKTRPGRPVGHCVTEAFYDGEWHLLDGDEHVICLRRDNRTIASEAEVVRDHDLMKRTHTYSVGAADSPLTDQFSASLYGYEGNRDAERKLSTHHTMQFTLRPGESLQWRWDHVGKEYSAAQERKPGEAWHDGLGTLSEWGATAYDNLRNGKWVYRPPLDRPVWRRGAVSVENLVAHGAAPGAAQGAAPTPLDPARPLAITWRIASPYVLVGGLVKCRYHLAVGGSLSLEYSPDGKAWQRLCDDTREGDGYQAADLDNLLSPRTKPGYQYYARLQLTGAGSSLASVTFDNDVQMALLAMPELVVGDNALRYTDESPTGRQVRLTHEWVERNAWHPPTAPTPAAPAAGAAVEGTNVVFRWTPATSPDEGVRIADYQVQVSERSDLRWVLSPNFDKLVSHTPSRDTCQWAAPFTGLLNPGQPYYWRVRAVDSRGVWGAWSAPRRFSCAAPGVPLNLQVVPGTEPGTLDLTWLANPAGRRPVAYKVYGSDEQGFTASDTEYVVRMGHGFCDTMEDFNARQKGDPYYGDVKTPANFAARTPDTQLTVCGPALLGKPNLNKAFYRVVAIDERGNESGPSDYAAAPRPFIYTAPPAAAAVATAWQYRPGALLSLGHLTCRGGYNPAYWQREKLSWTLVSGPPWLQVSDGVLAGTPPAAGTFETTLKAVSSSGREAVQSFTLAVR